MAGGRRWTYAELDDDINTTAKALMALGIQRGDRVGIWAPNGPEWVIVQFATAKIGAILVTVNPAYRTSELAYVLGQSGVRTLISAAGFRDADFVAMVAEVRSDASELVDVVFLGTDDWSNLRARADEVSEDQLRARMASLSNHDPINIQYTSGTTGFQRGHAVAPQHPQQRLLRH